MNIKKLCVLALAAAATVVTFSGCGGSSNSDDDLTSGRISTKKFASGSIRIYSVNTRSLEVIPESKLANSGKYTPNIVIPAATSEDETESIETSDSAFCSGTIGVRGGVQYDAELLYLYSEDRAMGCIQPIVTTSGYLDDASFLNACGYLSSDDLTDDDDDSYGSYFNKFERLTVGNLGSFTIRIILRFNEQSMTLITSGSGFTVTYYDDENNAYMTKVIDEERRTSNITFPYIVESR